MSDVVKTENLAGYFERSRGLERDHVGELIKSRKVAWRVACAAGVIALASVVAVAGLTPLKQPPEAIVVRVNNATGEIEHLTMLGTPLEDYGERIAKYYLNTYILNCEGYSWQTVQEQHDTCALLSAPHIQTQYGKRFEGQDAVTERLGANANIDVDVHSITLGANQSATVRFTTTEREVTTGNETRKRHLIATMAYEYVNVPLTEKVARVNFLGFQVTRYNLAADLSR